MQAEPSTIESVNQDISLADEILKRLVWARETYPGFALVLKSESWFMKLLYFASGMFIWNRGFMTEFTTTIGRRVYVTTAFVGISGCARLNHELCHVADAKKLTTPVFMALYLFPQCLALVSLLAFWKPLFLLSLVFLLPWPAPFRVWAEFRAYCVTLFELRRLGTPPNDTTIEWLREVFCGWSYYKMSWSFYGLERAFRKIAELPPIAAEKPAVS